MGSCISWGASTDTSVDISVDTLVDTRSSTGRYIGPVSTDVSTDSPLKFKNFQTQKFSEVTRIFAGTLMFAFHRK